MNKPLRVFIKQLVPPFLVNSVRRRPIFPVSDYIWKGVYSSFRAVPAVGLGHAAADRVEFTKRFTQQAIEDITIASGNEAPLVPSEYTQFPLLVLLTKLQVKRLAVLDVGGGLGISYAYLLASLPSLRDVDYYLVEVEDMCRVGQYLFAEDKRITFLSKMPGLEMAGKFDLVQSCSALQYIENYQEVIAIICSYRPRFIYLSKIPVGNFPTFVTAQYNLPGSVMPVWFFNYRDLISMFAAHGYQLVYQGTHDREYDTANFPPQNQMRRYSHLLFSPDSL